MNGKRRNELCFIITVQNADLRKKNYTYKLYTIIIVRLMISMSTIYYHNKLWILNRSLSLSLNMK